MNDLVSILIPAYNSEKWIRDTIKSALSQTWPKKEIIIVDDGSTDNTLQIAKQFESNLVKVITQENMGACAARNKALSFAQGDYIQWLDHDDILAPDKILEQLKESEDGKHSRILVSGSFGIFYFSLKRAKFKPDSLWKDLVPLEYFLTKFNENTWLHPSTWLVSRKLTELAGPWYDLRSPDDDGEYFCRVVAASEKIRFIKDAKSYWRIGNLGSLSQNVSDEGLAARLRCIRLCIDHLRSIEDSERTRAACVKYLQTWLGYFYPEQHELLQEINALAHELGGTLLPPELSWKYSLIKKIFGWEEAKKFRSMVRRTKLLAYTYWDRFLYKLSIE